MGDKDMNPQEGEEVQVGWKKKGRGCTDILFLLIFIIFWAAMIFIAVIALKTGDLSRLTRGVDFQGHACGVLITNDQGVKAAPETAVDANGKQLSNEEWESRNLIWWPIGGGSSSTDSGSLTDITIPEVPDASEIATKVLKLGVCVKECPSFTGWLPGSKSYVNAYDIAKTRYPVMYPSTKFFNFCIPGLEGADESVKEVVKKVVDKIGLGEFLLEGSRELMDAAEAIAISFGTAFLVSFIFLFILRFIAAPVTYFVLFAILVLLAGAGLLCWMYSGTLRSLEPPKETLHWVFKITAIVFWVLCLVYILLVIFLIKNIRIAIHVIKMVSKVMSSTRTLILVPPINFLFVVLLTWFSIIVFAFLQTSGKIQQADAEEVAGIFSDTDLPKSDVVTDETVKFLQRDNAATIMQYFTLFVYLWTLGWFNAIAFMVVAFIGVFWYFSRPGDDKSVGRFALLRAYYHTSRYHLGTLAVGSFIVAVLQFIRILLGMLEKKLQKWTKGTPAACLLRCCFCCLKCCLACWERIIRYVNKNAYIVCAIKGTGFCRSAYTAVKVLISNIALIGSANFIADFIVFLSKWLIVALNVGIAYALMKYTKFGDNVEVYALPLIVVGLLSFFVASVYMHIFATLQDTLLMCFCFDKEENNGIDKPYYFTNTLSNLVNKYNARQAQKTNQVAPEPANPESP
eukprot:TRINITY_DN67561_c12_g1_i1.p1 TRINITY_DN67561_c12_g1~~TRINITY_DN67561_c12_g1_i1.p1  ORF type:complete len:684 (-),score=46.79 TRINITY_DN67561_c12_g1_i1:2138-4189(-)